MGKTGKATLAKKEIWKLEEPQTDEHKNFLNWLKDVEPLNPTIVEKTKGYWYSVDNPESRYIFNLSSNNHLKWLFFDHLGETALSKTDGGSPQVDEDFLDSVKDSHGWVQLLLDYKKLMKLKSTYIEGILDRQIDGVIYSSYIQFGPPSGRFASKNPNLQNLPRVKEDDAGLSELVLNYVNSIKRGFIAPEGHLLVNADYSQLEPRAFAEACEDKLLQQVFLDNEDLYGSIACRVFKLSCTANEVKKLHPEQRQKAKVIALAVVYGAEAGRISKLMNISYLEAQEVISDYLNSYPGLKKYMADCNKEVCTKGYVKTKFGRVRHLPMAKYYYEKYGGQLLDKRWAKSNGLEEESWKFKSMLNLAKNYKIQGVAAYVVNLATIAINRELKARGIKGEIVAQTHDEVTCIVPQEHAEEVKEIVKRCMEETTRLSIPLKTEPLIGPNWAVVK